MRQKRVRELSEREGKKGDIYNITWGRVYKWKDICINKRELSKWKTLKTLAEQLKFIFLFFSRTATYALCLYTTCVYTHGFAHEGRGRGAQLQPVYTHPSPLKNRGERVPPLGVWTHARRLLTSMHSGSCSRTVSYKSRGSAAIRCFKVSTNLIWQNYEVFVLPRDVFNELGLTFSVHRLCWCKSSRIWRIFFPKMYAK